MRKAASIVLALVLCLTMAIPALAAGQREVRVTTAEELQEAIASNVKITLAPGTYEMEYGIYKYQVENLTITGEGKAEIVVTEPYDPVLSFSMSKGIVLENLTLGHSVSAEMSCEDGVLGLWSCTEVTVRNCDLYGCGVEGINAGGSSFKVENTTIRDCSRNIVSIYNSVATFTGCTFSDNGYNSAHRQALGYAVALYDEYDWDHDPLEVRFENCKFTDNLSPSFTNMESAIQLEDCTFMGNAWGDNAGTGSVMREVRISTAEELRENIVSNRKLILAPGKYNIEEAIFKSDISNLTITSEGGAEIVVDNGSDPVISLTYGKNITFENLTLGHELPPTMRGCFSGVLEFANIEGVTLKNCDLYGCGLEGINAYGCTMRVEDTVIRDCSANIATLDDSAAEFENCTFSGNGYSDDLRLDHAFNITGDDEEVRITSFDTCSFKDNKNFSFTNDFDRVVSENCTYSNNGWERGDGEPEEELKVVPTNQTLKVNGKEQETEIYNINDRNYFKLRDIAMLLNGTGSQFSVGYDQVTNTISVRTGGAYEPVGGELASVSREEMAKKADTAQKSAQKLLIDGEAIGLTAYNIGGNNFFGLRDLGEALGFTVDYDNATRTMIVDSQ